MKTPLELYGETSLLFSSREAWTSVIDFNALHEEGFVKTEGEDDDPFQKLSELPLPPIDKRISQMDGYIYISKRHYRS